MGQDSWYSWTEMGAHGVGSLASAVGQAVRCGLQWMGFSLNELMTCLEMGLLYGLVAMGVYWTFRIIDFSDMTCDGSCVLGAAVSAQWLMGSGNPWVAVLLAAVGGSLAGLCTAVVHVWGKVPKLLAGIIVGYMLYSINLRIMGGTPNVPLFGHSLIPMSFGTVLGVVAAVTALFVMILHTDFGLALRSIGSHSLLARHHGVSTSFMTCAGLMMGNALIASAGALLSQHQGFADIGSGVGTLIVGLASVMMGHALAPQWGVPWQLCACVLGSVIYRMVITMALHADSWGLQTWDLNIVTGVFILALLMIRRRKSNNEEGMA